MDWEDVELLDLLDAQEASIEMDVLAIIMEFVIPALMKESTANGVEIQENA